MRRARGEAFTDAAAPGLSTGSGRRTTVGRNGSRPASAFAGAAARGADAGALAEGAAFSRAAGCAVVPSPRAASTAITAPTGAESPSWTRTSASVPSS